MKEIPLLYSTPMVQSLLAGRKTMTRRIINPQTMVSEKGQLIWENAPASKTRQIEKDLPISYGLKDYCPYGQPGDLLWVRETFRKYCKVGKDGYTQFDNEILEYAADSPPLLYLMDGDGAHMYNKDGSEKYVPWRPSIHMPKAIARIWLQVESIRVERLHDITEEDAQAEGMEKMDDSPFPYKLYSSNTASCADAKTSFKFLWQNINGQESWESNPFVWAVSFKVLSTTGKPKEVII